MKTSHVPRIAVLAPAIVPLVAGCNATAASSGNPSVEAQLALRPPIFLFFFLIVGIGVAAAIASAARRRAVGGSVFGLLAGLVIVGPLLLLGIYGLAYVSAPRLPPPTVVYVQPPAAPLAPVVPLPNSAAPRGMTRILGPEEVPPPIEAVRPSESAEVAIAKQSVPDWITTGTVQEGDRTYLVVSGQQFADEATAWRDAVNRATAVVREDFEAAVRPVGRWLLDPNDARSIAVRNNFTEEIRRSAGDNEFTVYRTHLRVELSPTVREAIEPIWRQQVSTGRSLLAGGLLAFLTAAAAVFAGYFRLDDRTAGRYQWRLRVASILAIALVGSVVFGGLSMIPVRTIATPAVPAPIEAMPPAIPHPTPPDDLPQAQASPPEVVMHFGQPLFEQVPCGN